MRNMPPDGDQHRTSERADASPLPHARTIELKGHIVDSHILSQVMDVVMDRDAEFYVEQMRIGRHKFDPSYARIAIHAATPKALDELLEFVGKLGAQMLEEGDARTAPYASS